MLENGHFSFLPLTAYAGVLNTPIDNMIKSSSNARDDDNWLLEAYEAFYMLGDPLTVDDGIKLGVKLGFVTGTCVFEVCPTAPGNKTIG